MDTRKKRAKWFPKLPFFHVDLRIACFNFGAGGETRFVGGDGDGQDNGGGGTSSSLDDEFTGGEAPATPPPPAPPPSAVVCGGACGATAATASTAAFYGDGDGNAKVHAPGTCCCCGGNVLLLGLRNRADRRRVPRYGGGVEGPNSQGRKGPAAAKLQ